MMNHLRTIQLHLKFVLVFPKTLFSYCYFNFECQLNISLLFQVACKNEGLMCFGPLVNDGYAACYNPRPNDIYVACSAHNSCSETSAKKYSQALIDSFTELKKTLESAKPQAKL